MQVPYIAQWIIVLAQLTWTFELKIETRNIGKSFISSLSVSHIRFFSPLERSILISIPNDFIHKKQTPRTRAFRSCYFIWVPQLTWSRKYPFANDLVETSNGEDVALNNDVVVRQFSQTGTHLRARLGLRSFQVLYSSRATTKCIISLLNGISEFGCKKGARVSVWPRRYSARSSIGLGTPSLAKTDFYQLFQRRDNDKGGL